ncbi:MAG: type II toxin-antitoxin system RelE/ParE family toxin [Spirochaetales bacterium]|nr:type II toxin-antitoxin system RelE/ParE family toxin [Spirochaetales bacterium]
MNFRLLFAPEIEEDLLEGYHWYESKAKGLGEDFLRIFYALSSEIARNPMIYRRVYADFRRRLLKRFPYSIYFLVEDDLVIVFGLFHCSRNPQKIIEMLKLRENP